MARRSRLVTVLLLAAAAVLVLLAPASAGPARNPVPPISTAAPGTLLAAVPVGRLDPALAELGVRAWRITYVSRSGLDDRPIAVSGMVLEPAGRPPAGGWPIVAWAHGTTGVSDDCAPSATPDLGGQLGDVLPLLHQRFLVTATDYEGLGTPGPHPYLIPVAEGRGVIDSVRAARALVPDTSTRWVAFGASQGGQAAWASDELAAAWGSGLDLLGVAAAAPVTDLSALPTAGPTHLSERQRGLYPLILYGLKLQHPQLNYADYLRGAALAETVRIPVACGIQHTLATLPPADFTARSTTAMDSARDWLRANALPTRRATAPLFVAQGGADDIVEPQWTTAAVARACRLGDVIDYARYRHAPHPALPEAEPDILRWITDRFAGRPAPDTCSG